MPKERVSPPSETESLSYNSPLMRSPCPLFTVVCKPRILSLRARLRYNTAVTSLHTQTCCQDKLANRGTETTEERVEGL